MRHGTLGDVTEVAIVLYSKNAKRSKVINRYQRKVTLHLCKNIFTIDDEKNHKNIDSITGVSVYTYPQLDEFLIVCPETWHAASTNVKLFACEDPSGSLRWGLSYEPIPAQIACEQLYPEN